jgi:probable rRNA maturation factor
MQYSIYLDISINSSSQFIPRSSLLQKWFKSVIKNKKKFAEASLLIVDEDESRYFNHRWRNKNKPTNILSFPAEIPVEVNSPVIGDLVACAPIIELEAKNQGKDLKAHWAHMIIHGGLHLLGYDHILEQDAIEMEALETDILSKLGYNNPYLT